MSGSSNPLAPGAVVHGTVIEHHPWGVELRLDEEDAFGTVDIVYLSDDARQWGPAGYPPIGSRQAAVVQGMMPSGQLRLSLRETDLRAAGTSS
jgi:hypothetical protein